MSFRGTADERQVTAQRAVRGKHAGAALGTLGRLSQRGAAQNRCQDLLHRRLVDLEVLGRLQKIKIAARGKLDEPRCSFGGRRRGTRQRWPRAAAD